MVRLLEVKALEVAYGGIKAVKGIDLEVRSGELVTLIGANGAGKTTTLKALAGLLAPSRGSIRYDGRDITGAAAHTLVSSKPPAKTDTLRNSERSSAVNKSYDHSTAWRSVS